ncbi:MAG: hypothetical protein AB9836_08410 [Aminipila sp.]
MIKIVHKTDTETIHNLPTEVVTTAAEIATILDDCYGEARDAERDLGGYLLIAEEAQDLESIQKLVDFDYTIPEYVKMIGCRKGESYTNSLMLLSSDYSISLLIPLSLTPKELLQCIDMEA